MVFRNVIVFVVVVLTSFRIRAEDTAPAKYLELLDKPRNADATVAVRNWLERQKPAELSAAAAKEDPAIAVLCAWQQTDKESPAAIREFCGYIAGLTRLPVPHFWKRQLVALHVRPLPGEQQETDENNSARDTPEFLRNWSQHNDHLVLMEKEVGVSFENDRVIFTGNGYTVDLPEEDIFIQRRRHVVIKKSEAAPQCYVAAHSDVGRPYVLICYDLEKKQARWKSSVWGTGEDRLRVGRIFDEVSIVESASCIAVFGAAPYCYLEVFDRATGKCQLRFCDSVWRK